MATYLESMFDRRLSRIEEQIKQLKATQEYGLQQIRYYQSSSVSAPSIAWYDSNISMNIYGIHAVLEFQGSYTDKRLIAAVYPWFTDCTRVDTLIWTSGIQGGAFASNIIRFDLWGQSLVIPPPMSSDSYESYPFTLNAKVLANMEGVLKIVSVETVEGAYADVE